ncbi:MAG TPA: N-acetylmuramoyl-L-alanine amidase [Candidatus Sulfotelmatobacter sp.]|nr:N-acetylmuramoyl-L-alanine amidase [Candidatus Sulfotelmatobacter sp.]
MATPTTKPELELTEPVRGITVPPWPMAHSAASSIPDRIGDEPSCAPSPQDALQALLAFSSLHEQVRRRKALAARHNGFDSKTPVAEFDPSELFVLDDVLQLVAERAVSITGADGLAIALAENNEIVLRAAAGMVRPDIGARIDRDSAFSGACFRTAQVINCDDTETDPRVNLQACRKLGARSMVAVPLCGRRRVIGVLEAFSTWPFAFNDSDVRNLTLLAELVLAALKPEDEDRFAQSAQVAATKLDPLKPAVVPAAAAAPTQTVLPKIATTPVVAASAQPAPTQAAAPKVAAAPAEPAAPKVAPVPVPVPAKTEFSPAVPLPKVSAPGVAKETPVVVAPKVEAVKAATATALPEVKAVIAPAAPIEKAAATEVKASEAKIAEKGIAAGETAEGKIAEAATAESVTEPALTFGQTEPERSSRRFLVPAILIGIVVIAAFAGGVWWKLKMSEVGSSMVRSEAPVTSAPAPKPAAPPVAAVPAPPATSTNDANSEAPDSDNTPASPQELAKFPRITGVRHWSSPDSSTVVLDMEDQVQYETHRLTGPDRVYFDLHDTQLAPDLAGKSIDIGDTFLSRVRVAQPVPGMTRIVLETKPGTSFSVSLESNPYRLIVEVRKAGTNPKGAVNLFPNTPSTQQKMAIVIPPPTKEDLQLRARVPKLRIVVDAGHGGWDLGTVGRRGLLEKDLVLEIAQRLGKLLETRLGSDVIYTRQDDNYLPLDQRAEIANQAQADLFISVHANYSDLPSARGVETYYTNFFSAPGSKEAGTDLHTAAANANTPTLSAADLHDRIEQSRRLAASVQRSLYGTLSVQNPGLRDRGVKEASFVVLTESAMPGILAEVSFVSSPTDEQKLRSDGYRERIAEALYRGIARYAAQSKGVKMASSQTSVVGR